MKTKMMWAGALAMGASLICAQSASAAEWSDTSIGYRYGTQFQEPYNGKNITKNIYSLTHVSGYKYGSNFFNVDMLQSDSTDANAQEAYVVYRNTVDLGKVTGKSYAFGPVRGMGITGGFDWNTKNGDGYNSKKRMLVVGPTFMVDVPGFLNVSLLVLKESNFPKFITSRYSYKTHPMLNLAWGIPVGSTGLSFEGFMNYIASKGTDESGGATAAETNIDAALMYDLGTPMGAGKNTFRVGLGYQYWHNKFGNLSSVPGSFAKTPMVKAEYHF
jgi:nucleoside-specific outer membrane channel protein Tsx